VPASPASRGAVLSPGVWALPVVLERARRRGSQRRAERICAGLTSSDQRSHSSFASSGNASTCSRGVAARAVGPGDQAAEGPGARGDGGGGSAGPHTRWPSAVQTLDSHGARGLPAGLPAAMGQRGPRGDSRDQRVHPNRRKVTRLRSWAAKKTAQKIDLVCGKDPRVRAYRLTDQTVGVFSVQHGCR